LSFISWHFYQLSIINEQLPIKTELLLKSTIVN
jgi:hypothetical protein